MRAFSRSFCSCSSICILRYYRILSSSFFSTSSILLLEDASLAWSSANCRSSLSFSSRSSAICMTDSSSPFVLRDLAVTTFDFDALPSSDNSVRNPLWEKLSSSWLLFKFVYAGDSIELTLPFWDPLFWSFLLALDVFGEAYEGGKLLLWLFCEGGRLLLWLLPRFIDWWRAFCYC